MAGRSGGLGKKGLDSVFGGKKDAVPAMAKNENANELPIKDLIPNPYQPRKTFNEDKMKELVNSVRESGIIQPLIVRKNGTKYEIVAGERRYRAAQEVGLKKVPVVIRKYDDAAMKEVALVENLQRSDLNPMEEALGIQAFIDDLKITQAEAGKRLGKSRAAITNSLRLLNLPEEVKEYVAKGDLTPGQARPLLGLDDTRMVRKLAKQAVSADWSSKIMEEFVAAEKEGATGKVIFQKKNAQGETVKEPKKKVAPKPQDVYSADFEEQLRDYLGTKVSINQNKDAATGGKIVIEYYNLEDLERLTELLQKPKAVFKPQAPKKFNI